MRLTFFRSKQRTSSSDEQQQKEYFYQNKKKKTNHYHHSHHYHHHHHTSHDDNYTPQHYFHSLKANGALVLHRQLQRRSSMDEILDITNHASDFNNLMIGTPQPSRKYKKIPTTWSPATAPSPATLRQHQYSTTTDSTEEDSNKVDEKENDDTIQQRRQELLKYYLSQHQQRNSKLLLTQEENYNKTNTMVMREEKLEREVQHLKRMVTLLRDMVLSSTSASPSLKNSFNSINNNYDDNNNCNGNTSNEHTNNGSSNSSYISDNHDNSNKNQHVSYPDQQEPNNHNSAAAVVTYERKLQILFQEIGALHKEQESSAIRYRELQQRHDELCTKLREKDEMVSCLQSDLRALMINHD